MKIVDDAARTSHANWKRRALQWTAGALMAAMATVQTAEAAPPTASTQSYLDKRLNMAFVLVPAGSFRMGAGDQEREAGTSERPRHEVHISRSFYMARHEVTQAQWEMVMEKSPFEGSRSNPFYDLPGMAQRLRRPDQPATVSWNEAQAFIARLNAKEARPVYRLPTEAEWEYAARAGTSTLYSFGDNEKDLANHAWYGEDFVSGATHPVGQKKPNPWGLYDMHGNVWEWASDWYGPYSANAATDPAGPASGTSKVVRGGSWHSSSGGWNSSIRKPYPPDYRGISIGLRLVRIEPPTH
ncbi:formylglycine-generating enzyme family protein [Variovorax saccharolyticus]|uniref:formylglycine-generating enzyme family protein n=1 Tax=Variovorax saccharolyticus TaxID=3053516 RepID=UPI0025788A99|nr:MULTISPECIES: formylglycine-generating enzyme family protein [unclassified Variovorax]MDM0022403.1 formylglycine-generating enzyme family protein [Variovorax sp. J22R187]MDM0029058.1 formylglycine-generating enzyme family protein [Variovorax sp. J31P216]